MKRYRRDDEDLELSVEIKDLGDRWEISLTFTAQKSGGSRTLDVIPSYVAPSEKHRKLKEILPTTDLPHSATYVEQALILAASEAVSEWVDETERGSDEYNRLMHLQADALFDWWVSDMGAGLLGESLRSRSSQKGRASS